MGSKSHGKTTPNFIQTASISDHILPLSLPTYCPPLYSTIYVYVYCPPLYSTIYVYVYITIVILPMIGFKAPAQWLAANHPKGKEHWRDQPNYAILVDTRDRKQPQITYVPQENIEIITKTKVNNRQSALVSHIPGVSNIRLCFCLPPLT